MTSSGRPQAVHFRLVLNTTAPLPVSQHWRWWLRQNIASSVGMAVTLVLVREVVPQGSFVLARVTLMAAISSSGNPSTCPYDAAQLLAAQVSEQNSTLQQGNVTGSPMSGAWDPLLECSDGSVAASCSPGGGDSSSSVSPSVWAGAAVGVAVVFAGLACLAWRRKQKQTAQYATPDYPDQSVQLPAVHKLGATPTYAP